MFRRTTSLHRLTALLTATSAMLALAAAPSQAATHHTSATLHPSGAHASIIGGYTPDPSQWPWMAALTMSAARYAGSDFDRQFCGGTLVAPRVVMTAAHCVTEKDGSQTVASTMQVVLGKRDLSLAGGEHLNVQSIERHPLWDRNALRHDLALLYLAAPSGATPAALVWPNSQIPAKTSLTVMGWGRVNVGANDRTASNTLKAVDLPLWSDGDCAAATSAWAGGSVTYDPATQLCAGWNTGTDSTCKGDSGGPLMFADSTGTWRLFGAVSYGKPDCNSTAAPTVFAWLGAADMLSFVTSGIATAAGLGAPVSAPAPTTPTTPAPANPAPRQPVATPAVAPTVAADRTAPQVLGVRMTPSVVRSGRRMHLRVDLDEGGNVTLRLRGPRGVLVSGTVYGRSGGNIVSLPTKLQGHLMLTGRWSATVSVTDAAGNRSGSSSTRFRITR